MNYDHRFTNVAAAQQEADRRMGGIFAQVCQLEQFKLFKTQTLVWFAQKIFRDRENNVRFQQLRDGDLGVLTGGWMIEFDNTMQLKFDAIKDTPVSEIINHFVQMSITPLHIWAVGCLVQESVQRVLSLTPPPMVFDLRGTHDRDEFANQFFDSALKPLHITGKQFVDAIHKADEVLKDLSYTDYDRPLPPTHKLANSTIFHYALANSAYQLVEKKVEDFSNGAAR